MTKRLIVLFLIVALIFGIVALFWPTALEKESNEDATEPPAVPADAMKPATVWATTDN